MSHNRNNCIYVGKLPPYIRREDLQRLFFEFGYVTSINLRHRRAPELPFAFIEYKYPRAATNAVRTRDGYNYDHEYRLKVAFRAGGDFRRARGGGGHRGRNSRRPPVRDLVTAGPSVNAINQRRSHRQAGQSPRGYRPQPIDEYQNQQGQQGQPHQLGENETFPMKSGVRNEGLKYETRIRSVLAAQWALNKNVKDFWIITNPPDVEDFEDVIAIPKDKEDKEYLFMIQLKHTMKAMQVITGDSNAQNIISLKKFKQSFDVIRSGNFEGVLKDELKKRHIRDYNKYFCIFTTMTKAANLTENIMGDNDALRFLDVSDCKKYSMRDDNIDDEYREFCRRLYFLTEQPECKSVCDFLYPILPGGFDKMTMDAFFNLVENTNPLTRPIYLRHCARLQLTKDLKNEISCRAISSRIKNRECLDMWDQIFKNYSQIIIDNADTTPKITSLLFSYYEHKIQSEYSSNFCWNECYNAKGILDGAVINDLQDHELRAHFREVRHLSDLVVYMWINDKIPIMLNEDHKKFLADPLLKEAASGKRFVMTSEFQDELASEQIKKFRNGDDLTTMDSELVTRILQSIDVGDRDITPSALFGWTSNDR